MAHYEKRGERSWRLTVHGERLADGTKELIRKTIVVEDDALLKTKRKLKDYLDGQLAAFKIEVESGKFIKIEKVLFKDFIKIWDENYANIESNLAKGTKKTYDRHLKNHIIPKFGHMFLDEIMPIHIDKFVVDLSNTRIRGKEDNFLSSGTIEYIYRVLKNVLTRAHKWKFIRENPMAELDKPKAKYKTFDIYDADEARQVIECLYKETTMWRLFILGTMLGGFRRGEIIAVEWTDVCFDDLTISVNKNITGTEKGKAIIGDPKTEKSKDTVDMPEWYMEELKKYNTEWKKNKLKAGSMWQGSDNEYVFHGGFGKPFYHTYPSEWWKRFCKRHKLKYIRFHDLRHTTATLLIEDGANMKEIQKRLRHSRYQTTADIYGHVTKKLSRATADRFNKLDPTKNVDRKIHSQFTPN